MKIANDIKKEIGEGWIPVIYRDKIRSQRTRSHSFPIAQKENSAEIFHTLLGVELKIKKTRFACPDLSTARYMRVFAWIGSADFAIPYDVSQLSNLADELESSWYRMLLILDTKTKTESPQFRGRIRASLIRKIREEIAEIGAGPKMPKFKTSTKHRKS